MLARRHNIAVASCEKDELEKKNVSAASKPGETRIALKPEALLLALQTSSSGSSRQRLSGKSSQAMMMKAKQRAFVCAPAICSALKLLNTYEEEPVS